MTTSTAPTRRWTYADYCRLPADGKRHEIIDGRHFVNPAPSPYHQTVSLRLAYELMRLVDKPGRGRVFVAPIDVHLGRGTLVQPDLVVLRPKNASIIGPKKLSGVPDLVAEVLSPSTRTNDRRLKKARYERAGVREFWLVDPNAETVEQFVLRGKRYAAPTLHTESITLRILRGITIDLREVW
ncbi:MAG: Uma2 family endonuclease [Planctomycetota bacterium]